jgi:hypothetical protein
VDLNLPRSGLVQQPDAEDGSKRCLLYRNTCPLLILAFYGNEIEELKAQAKRQKPATLTPSLGSLEI